MVIAYLGIAVPPVAHATDVDAIPEAAGLTWERCAEVAAEWDKADKATECAMLTVPLDYAKPQGRKVQLAVSRIKATDPAQRKGTLLINPGGPGVEGLSEPEQLTSSEMGELGKHFDLVGFDIRGTGHSDKPGCPEFDPDNFPHPPPGQAGESEAKHRNDAYAAALKTCALKDPEFSRAMTTTYAAKDMDRIRAALGEEKISYLGNSWGASLGAVYRGLFDEHVDRMVLDSVIAPGQSTDDKGGEAQLAAQEKLYQDFTTWMADRDPTLHLGSTASDVSRKLLALRKELEAKPRGEITAEELNDYLESPRAQWAPAAQALRDIAAGKAPETPTQDTAERTSGNGFGKEMVDGDLEFVLRAVGCNESEGSRDFEVSDKEAQKQTFPVAGYRGGSMAICSGWPFPAQPPKLSAGKSPLQMFGHAYETNTPLPWAKDMHRITGGSLSVINDDVHSSLRDLVEPAKDAVAFLLGGASFERTYEGMPIDDPS
ncbi:alpha/beta fold hydrolase [Streptomyces sp. BA2]|uniref:alpha/beta fold hydrolase n=1 Tax=Streptomyces sp. BA2 TaxID=436595 RepID=UPI00136A9027|nr:alpha/beta fold hydrolase [Streptomyces sp. BA2]